jgi:hypothetical protein
LSSWIEVVQFDQPVELIWTNENSRKKLLSGEQISTQHTTQMQQQLALVVQNIL